MQAISSADTNWVGSANPGVADGWYVNTPLSPTNTTLITVTADNGAVIATNSVVWLPVKPPEASP